ncbi:MAG TPA: DUF3108 domain-containing protein [Bdellovibrionota bacterium]|jgi:hypothetical protein
MRNLWILIFLLSACAGHQPAPQAISEKDFAVPAKLADQFAVREAGPAAAPAAIPIAPPIPKEKGKAAEKSVKKSKKKGMQKAEAKPNGAETRTNVYINRWTMPPVFQTGERTVFDITYFGATAGQLELEIMPPKVVAERTTFHFRAVASTTSIFSLFYRVNDVAESFMDSEGLFSHKFSIKLDESRQQRDVLELYDQEKRKAYYWSKLERPDKDMVKEQSEIELVPFTQDGLSSFFFVRTLPLEIGKVYEFPVVNNGKLRTVRVTPVRKEDLKTKAGEFPSIVVKPEVVLDGVMQSHGESFMWVSDDAQRRILKIDAKIKVGSVIAYLRELSYGGKPVTSASAAP